MSQTPSHIARYTVVQPIAAGGMGEVFLARDERLDRLVAIKLLRDGFDNDELRGRFEEEARNVAKLTHPNIVTIYEYGAHDGRPYIAMEYVAGRSMAEIIKRQLPVPLARRVRLVEELCSGLGHAHKAHLVHRDVKPANLMVATSGMLKVLDFGIAKLRGTDRTQKGMLVGTVNYMSPEQITGQPVDHRSDIFAVGAVLHELLTYEQAFKGDLTTAMFNIVHGRAAPLVNRCPGLDPAFQTVLDRCLAKDPTERYQDLATLKRDLGKLRRPLEDDESDFAETLVALDSDDTVMVTLPPSSIVGAGPDTQRALNSALSAAEAALASGLLESALRHAEQALALEADNRTALDLLARTKRAIAAAHLQSQLGVARDALGADRIDDARTALREAAKAAPDSQTVRDLAAKVEQRAADLARFTDAVQAARQRLAEHDFDEARQLAQSAVPIQPDDTGLKRLNEQIDRAAADQRQWVEDESRAVEALVDRQEFDQALVRLEQAVTKAPRVRELAARVLEVRAARDAALRAAELERREEAARQAEMARRRKEEERRAAEAKRREEEARLAEEARRRQEEELRAAEAKRRQEEARLAEEARRRQEEELRAAEAKRREEEARRTEEARQRKEQERRTAEAKRREDEARQAEEARQRKEEERRAAEAARREEEARRTEEARQRKERELRAAEAKRREDEARQADEERRRKDDDTRPVPAAAAWTEETVRVELPLAKTEFVARPARHEAPALDPRMAPVREPGDDTGRTAELPIPASRTRTVAIAAIAATMLVAMAVWSWPTSPDAVVSQTDGVAPIDAQPSAPTPAPAPAPSSPAPQSDAATLPATTPAAPVEPAPLQPAPPASDVPAPRVNPPAPPVTTRPAAPPANTTPSRTQPPLTPPTTPPVNARPADPPAPTPAPRTETVTPPVAPAPTPTPPRRTETAEPGPAPVATPPAAPPSADESAAALRRTDEAQIRALMSSFGQAYQAEDIGRIKAIWPGMARSVEDSYRSVFQSYSRLSWTIAGADVELAGNDATARCNVQVEQTELRSGRTNSQTRSYQFRMQRQRGGWSIVGVQMLGTPR